MHSVIKPLNLERQMSFLLKHASGFKIPTNIFCLQRKFQGKLIQQLPDRLGIYRITCTRYVHFQKRNFMSAFNKTEFIEIAAQLMK